MDSRSLRVTGARSSSLALTGIESAFSSSNHRQSCSFSDLEAKKQPTSKLKRKLRVSKLAVPTLVMSSSTRSALACNMRPWYSKTRTPASSRSL